MSDDARAPHKRRGFHLTVDGWAVAVALALALLVRLGIINRVPW
jgi:hypothetical protein